MRCINSVSQNYTTTLFSLLADSNYLTVQDKTPTKVLVTMQDRKAYLRDYLGIAKTLRSSGIPTEVYLNPHSLREQIGYASSKQIPLAVIAGGSEMDHDTVIVKDLEHHTQETISGDSMVTYIRSKLENIRLIV